MVYAIQMPHYSYDKQVWKWNWKSSFCIFNVNKSFFVIFMLLDTDNDVRRIAYACLVYQYTYV